MVDVLEEDRRLVLPQRLPHPLERDRLVEVVEGGVDHVRLPDVPPDGPDPARTVAQPVLSGAAARVEARDELDVVAGPERLEALPGCALGHDDPERHGLITAEELNGLVDDEMLHAILAHAQKVERETPMDHALWCADPTTGFIVAAALVRPEKDLENVEVKSLKKRWKEGAFAKGASREQMADCEILGIERDEFLEIALTAMKARRGEIGL